MRTPSVRQMLEVGKSSGGLIDAYTHYVHHFDLFFDVSDFNNQYKVFTNDLKRSGLLELKGNDYIVRDMSIKQALEVINNEV